MSRSMMFRNSGKLNFGGRSIQVAMAVVLVAIIVLAVVVAVRRGGWRGGQTVKMQDEYRIKCIRCGAEWAISRKEIVQHGAERGGRRNAGMDCPECGARETAFPMTKCPKCGKWYLPKRFTDPDGYASRRVRDICPECGTDLLEWHRKRMRER